MLRPRLSLEDGSQIELRRPKPSELPAMARAFQGVLRERLYFVRDRYVFEPAAERKWLRSQSGSRGAVVAAFADGKQLVGFVTVVRGRWAKNAHTAEIDTILVVPSFRGKGVGRALIVEAIAWARNEGVTKLCIGAIGSNRRALALYRSFGFVNDGIERRQYRVGGRMVDNYRMAKWLTR